MFIILLKSKTWISLHNCINISFEYSFLVPYIDYLTLVIVAKLFKSTISCIRCTRMYKSNIRYPDQRFRVLVQASPPMFPPEEIHQRGCIHNREIQLDYGYLRTLGLAPVISTAFFKVFPSRRLPFLLNEMNMNVPSDGMSSFKMYDGSKVYEDVFNFAINSTILKWCIFYIVNFFKPFLRHECRNE